MPTNKKGAKNAASRKDTFYRRAKEEGYRARSSYKLVHLNNLHGFLKKAKVCIDLCAAPGSWMQVAREMMPSGGVIVGVDLFAIKPIPGTLSIKGDITTESLRTELRSTLKTFKADVVLHDGAPNVGCNWAQDAYDQNALVLHAFKLACEFLRYGGDFVTKVFRSKDSSCLEFVFKALFQSVSMTKPQASRHESAEIFYICRFFKLRAGDKADPRFFDPKEVFKEVDPTEATKINLQKPEKVRRAAKGYEDGAEILYKTFTVTEFLEAMHFEDVLQTASALLFDVDRWINHPSTTAEIRACCEDIKVLGRKELRMLLTWRKTLKAEIDSDKKIEEEVAAVPETPKTAAEEELDEMEKVEQEIKELEAASAKDDKKKQKIVRKNRRLLQQKLKMISMSNVATPDTDEFFKLKEMEKVNDDELLMQQYDASDSEDDTDLIPRLQRYKKGDFELDDSGRNYRLKGELSDTDSEEEVRDENIFKVRKKSSLKTVTADGLEIVPKEDMNKKHKKAVRFAEDASDDDSDSEDDYTNKKKGTVGGEESDEDNDSGMEEEDEDDDGKSLMTDLVGDVRSEKRERRAESWFSQDIFNDLESDADEDLEVDAAVMRYQKSGGRVQGETMEPLEDIQNLEAQDESSQPEVPAPIPEVKRVPLKVWLDVLQTVLEHSKTCVPQHVRAPPTAARINATNLDSNSIVPDINTVDMSGWGHDTDELKGREQFPALSAAGLALAAQLIQTKKSKRDFELGGWNRYMKGTEEDICLPDWFKDDEDKNMQPVFNIPEEDVRFYTARDKAVNARTLKKVMEAKARKQRRFKKTMQTVMKKAESAMGSSLLSDREKQDEVKNLYKKALKSRAKKETTYVVMKKHMGGKKPKGITGKSKMVDARMKADVRAKMKSLKKIKTTRRGKKKR